eukprot:3393059-Rhodomonas_salina.1
MPQHNHGTACASGQGTAHTHITLVRRYISRTSTHVIRTTQVQFWASGRTLWHISAEKALVVLFARSSFSFWYQTVQDVSTRQGVGPRNGGTAQLLCQYGGTTWGIVPGSVLGHGIGDSGAGHRG